MASKPDEAKPEEMPPASKHFDYKHYLTKKTMAQGLLDISLLMSNMSQLKSVLDSGQDSSYFILLVTLISVSLVLQVIVAHMLWILAVSRGSTQEQLNRQNILNNTIIILILIITESTPITFNYYRYATKKTMAQGLLDVALLMSNASQLKAILDVGEAHDYYHALVAIVIISISLQVITGILLLILGSLKDHTERHVRRANILNNIIIGFILFITVANIFITAFGVQFSQKNKSPNPLFDPNNNNF